MPRQSKPTHKKLPMGKVMWKNSSGTIFPVQHKGLYSPVVVIPCHTPAQARQICKAAKFLQMGEQKQVKFMQRVCDEGWSARPGIARAVLRAMGMGDGK